MSEHDNDTISAEEAEAKAARMEYARRAGILLPEIAAMPDGGEAFLGTETWRKLQDYAAMRSKLGK